MPHTTAAIHTELVSNKGLALLQGQVVEGSGVSPEEAKYLLLCLQKFYGARDGRDAGRRKLLERFSEGDATFKIEELVEEAGKIV